VAAAAERESLGAVPLDFWTFETFFSCLQSLFFSFWLQLAFSRL
jgi:hypothetical protein